MFDKLLSVDQIPIDENEIRQMSPITLAFLGDAVYELLVREYLIKTGVAPANRLHRRAVQYVKAQSQARAAEKLLPILTPEEKDILRRGRNANTSHVPKNADPLDYRHATGFEAMFGYLYLIRDYNRIGQIFRAVLEDRQDDGGEY